MAKKAKRTAGSTAQEAVAAPETLNASTTTPRSRRTWSLLFDVKARRALYLVLLAALYSPLSQLILAPVYGSIPSAVYHKYGLIASAMLSFVVKDMVPPFVEKLFGAFACWIPVIHFVLFQFSSVLGNPTGPLITECLTTYPVIMLSMSLASKELESLDLSFLNENVVEVAPSMLNYFLFTILQRTMRNVLPTWMGMSRLFTRIGLQTVIAATFTAVIPHSMLWPAIPAVAFTTVANTHAPLVKTTEVLNNTLALHNYSLVERHESVTGYISVLQDNHNKFRVMRCDHSLLGGEWLLPADPTGQRKVAEPVYAVFTMLEAVRLVEREKSAEQERALNIGLGVGTAPSALMAHGINTSVIELDPVVHHFAMKYFSLPRNHEAYIGDAVGIVETTKADKQAHYDYIIHDVFTGGAEPVDLFTYEFLSSLNGMLKPNGVIAINYAGDLAMSSTSLIYRTILEVLPSCRVFREDEQVAESDPDAKGINGDFTNMVFICNKGIRPVKFRKAVEADFLGSASRRAYMVPKYEVAPSKFQHEGELLTRANTKVLEKMHVQSAIGHWKLMRKVMPAAVWENW